jgi:hypothetical protein
MNHTFDAPLGFFLTDDVLSDAGHEGHEGDKKYTTIMRRNAITPKNIILPICQKGNTIAQNSWIFYLLKETC